MSMIEVYKEVRSLLHTRAFTTKRKDRSRTSFQILRVLTPRMNRKLLSSWERCLRVLRTKVQRSSHSVRYLLMLGLIWRLQLKQHRRLRYSRAVETVTSTKSPQATKIRLQWKVTAAVFLVPRFKILKQRLMAETRFHQRRNLNLRPLTRAQQKPSLCPLLTKLQWLL